MERQMKKKERKKSLNLWKKKTKKEKKNGYSVKSVDAYAYNEYSLKVKCSSFLNP